MDIQQTLKQQFGFEHFRLGQQAVVENLLAGHSTLAIFPTGAGKSLCYQFTALQLPHLTLVVSPLLALMKDQLDFLQNKGIAAASLDSTLSPDEYTRVVQGVRSGQIKILMVSVERFKNERFRQFIEGVAISLLVVDEAHCMSEWGHNFRPDYLKLPTYRNNLTIPLVLLLTATATKRVKLDMAKKFAIAPEHIVQTGFYRANLDLAVFPVEAAQKNAALLRVLKLHCRDFGGNDAMSGVGIVYVTLQKTAEDVAAFLVAQGVNAKAYHAGLDNDIRQSIQNGFMAGDISVVVATIAFGMGVDKADIRFVVHYDLPKSIENFSQEIGRAGRDDLPSRCVVLANLDGLQTVENFVYGDTPEHHSIAAVLAEINAQTRHQQWELQLYALSNLSNIRQLTLKTLLVQLELRGVLTALYSYSAEHKVKLLTPIPAIVQQFSGERADFIAAVLGGIAFKKVWGEVDFTVLYDRYGAERKRVLTALEYLHEKHFIELQSSGLTEVYSVNTAALDQPALVDELFQAFKQHELAEITRIGYLVRFLESKVCLSFGLARYFDDANAPEHCGHCSVCRGRIAVLTRTHTTDIPAPTLLLAADNVKKYLHAKGEAFVSNELLARYLAGISVPLFTRTKAKQAGGFALAETMRYADILSVLDAN